MTTAIIGFYSEEAAPSQTGRPDRDFTLQDFLEWDDDTLEIRHDYIQHVFPLPEASGYSYNAPLVKEVDYHAFRSDRTLQSFLRKAFDRMCKFYGLVVTRTPSSPFATASYTLTPSSILSRRKPHNWLMSFDHNHLRITRIIRSLRVLGLATEAQLFQQCLTNADAKLGRIVSSTSKMYWQRAAQLPLWEAPDPAEWDVEWLKAVEIGDEGKDESEAQADSKDTDTQERA